MSSAPYRPKLAATTVALVWALAACALIKPDPAVDQFGRGLLKAVEHGDSAALVGEVDPALTSSTAWLKLAELRDTLEAWRPDSAELVGWNVFSSPGAYNVNLTYQLHGPTGWGIAALAVTRREGTLRATGLHLERLPGSLQQLNRFSLAGRSWRHYFFLSMAIGSVLCCLAGAILVWRTPMPRRWLWTFVALLGVGQFGINWSTGETFTNPWRVQLFGAGYSRPGWLGPWLVTFALPVGAAYALWRRHQFLASRAAGDLPNAAA